MRRLGERKNTKPTVTNNKPTSTSKMKTLIICVMAIGTLGFLPSCAEERVAPVTRSTTTTTETTTVRHPATRAVETTTYRSN